MKFLGALHLISTLIPIFIGLFLLMLEGDKYSWVKNRKLLTISVVASVLLFCFVPELYWFSISQGSHEKAAEAVVIVVSIVVGFAAAFFAHIVLRWAHSPRGTK